MGVIYSLLVIYLHKLMEWLITLRIASPLEKGQDFWMLSCLEIYPLRTKQWDN